MPEPLQMKKLGSGPAVVLVHGGVGPEITWERQYELAERFKLVIPWRRGYPPNPPVARQDWGLDAEDLLGLLDEPAHLVGFSYGGVGAALAAERAPERFRSLTLIETPLWSVAADDPEVAGLIDLSDEFADAINEGGSPPAEFLELAGISPQSSPRAAAELERVVEIARGMRSPGEAVIDLPTIGAALPSLVLSGDHNPGIERVCDAIAAALGGERAVLPGTGHAIPHAPGFNDRLTEFLCDAER